MAYLTLSLEENFKGLQPYSKILTKSKQFDDLQKALKFCQKNKIVFACYISQWDGPGNDAEIEAQCSMNEVELEYEKGELYSDLDWV